MQKQARNQDNGPTLVVMAAGMGSRYGGLKQIDPIGPNGEWILDYSIYDAIRAGFRKAVFVIRKEFEQPFKTRLEPRLNGRIQTAYAYQQLDSLVPPARIPSGRSKPWGTGHAVLVAREHVDGPFVVVNSDDYYGLGAYQTAAKALVHMPDDREQLLVGYPLRNTLSEYGGVTRGICEYDGNGYLTSISEQKDINRHGDDGVVRSDGLETVIPGDRLVSMNFWGFQPAIFEAIAGLFEQFLREHADTSHEFLLPDIVNTLVQQGRIAVRVMRANDTWFGVTYKQDKQQAAARIRELIKQGQYPQELWA